MAECMYRVRVPGGSTLRRIGVCDVCVYSVLFASIRHCFLSVDSIETYSATNVMNSGKMYSHTASGFCPTSSVSRKPKDPRHQRRLPVTGTDILILCSTFASAL